MHINERYLKPYGKQINNFFFFFFSICYSVASTFTAETHICLGFCPSVLVLQGYNGDDSLIVLCRA